VKPDWRENELKLKSMDIEDEEAIGNGNRQ
jgi:hypothetical protein